ncbi:hypothetical protein AeRB84_015618 [Aphanomyces euteiches]|nr:hypothetical protein AeRB84_015618 [Aphanomyces euteiches]
MEKLEAGPAVPDVEYKISERAAASLNAILEKDKDDESLQRYKAKLLGAAAQGDIGGTASSRYIFLMMMVQDTKDRRSVVVQHFKVVFENNRQEITYCLDTQDGLDSIRNTPFEMEEGAKYKFAISFRVNRDIVSGLRFHNKVCKHLFTAHEEVVLGSYAPQSCSYEFVFPRHEWSEAPSGMLYRGRYHGECKFVDSDDKEHLRFQYSFGTRTIHLSTLTLPPDIKKA